MAGSNSMTHEGYIKKRDEALKRFASHSIFWSDGHGGNSDDSDYTLEQAAQAIDALVLEVSPGAESIVKGNTNG